MIFASSSEAFKDVRDEGDFIQDQDHSRDVQKDEDCNNRHQNLCHGDIILRTGRHSSGSKEYTIVEDGESKDGDDAASDEGVEHLEDDSKLVNRNVNVFTRTKNIQKLHDSRNIEDDRGNDGGDDVGQEDAVVAPHGHPVLVAMRGAHSIKPLHSQGQSHEDTCSCGDMTETVSVGEPLGEKVVGWIHVLEGQHQVGQDHQEVHNTESNQHMVENIPHLP